MLALDGRPQGVENGNKPHPTAFPRRTLLRSQAAIIPAIAGCLMICASFFPWLEDPLGHAYSAWELPVDIGWQFRTGVFNYGLLCLCCAIYAFVVAYAIWRPFKGSNYPFSKRHVTAAVLCLVPVLLFILQYLCIDVAGIDLLAQHKMQVLLIQQHFGYGVTPQRIAINPFLLDTSAPGGRAVLLINQLSFGLLLPFLSTGLLLYARRFVTVVVTSTTSKKRHHAAWIAAIVLLLVVLGRAPAAIACEDEAKALLATGSNLSALNWLNAALILNPSLNQVAFYHIERGQALYFLHQDQQSDDSRAYLAFTYREQGDYLHSYQQLLALWQAHRTTPWVVHEMSMTLERLAQFIQPLNGPPVRRPNDDERALPWLQLLTQVDDSNAYAHYVAGHIQYGLHNYTQSMDEMSMVIHMSTNADVQSSAYTYMALSDAGQGNYADERTLLDKALALDPNYHNNTAREELSGLR